MDLTKITDLAIQYGMKIVIAIAVFIIGSMVIKMITKMVGKALTVRGVDATLHPFLKGLVSTLLKVALVISILGMVGIKTTSFVAILGAAGLAVGMALQGSLGNFAGGVLILIFKPFKVGDVVQAQGYTGKISEVGIFCTVMKTPDNKTIILPNGPLAGGSMINFSTEATRRVDWTFGVAYGDDIKKAQDTLIKILNDDSRIMKDPAPFARVGELADSSVNFTVRAWVNAADFWDVHFDVIEKVKTTFDETGLNFPFPQQEVHVIGKHPTQ
ncbi:MAG: mechanosensitive ion channel protein MscS [Halobacteriovorax sp.]|nr:mechanosensitive ion channel protein MscS [Halobacteriovorax sp.]|tara:strand:+ start:47086 stop:47898 length:813 start_codon:yes stop_codon:yes gene_type:complete